MLGSGLQQQHERLLRHKRFGLSICLLGQYNAEFCAYPGDQDGIDAVRCDTSDGLKFDFPRNDSAHRFISYRSFSEADCPGMFSLAVT